jgi:Icc-related predicted phosphoesterase
MKIIALPDIHDDIINLLRIGRTLSEVDLVLLVGDLTNNGSASDAEKVVRTVQRFNASIMAIPGNWDGPEVEITLSRTGINLHRKHMALDGLVFIGIGAALPGLIQSPNEFTEEEFELLLREATTGLDEWVTKILVCHQPPYNTYNDLAQGNVHVGSKAVRKFIEDQQPLICFTGHIHEGAGIDHIGETQTINPGPLSQGHYAYAEITSMGIQSLEIRKIKP